MRLSPVSFGAGLALLLTGCTSTPVVLAPVGPSPAAIGRAGSNGQLVVYSAWQGRTEGNNPVWHQHSDYVLYDPQGRRLRYVDNTVGNYERTPRVVTLPAGKYFVKAQAEDYLGVKVPVVIEPGRTTRVHLDGDWKPPVATPTTELVSVPAGYPVGWRAPAS